MTMNKRKYLVALAAVGGLIAIGALAPQPARAVYTSPVTVYNTNAQPIPGTDVERMARIPYMSSVQNSSCSGTGNGCIFFFATPPAGYRLVAENLSGYFQISPVATAPVTGYLETNGTFTMLTAFSAPLGQIDLGGHIQAAFDTPTKFYVDPGQSVLAVASANWSNGNNALVLTGHLENCSITGCPAIAH